VEQVLQKDISDLIIFRLNKILI